MFTESANIVENARSPRKRQSASPDINDEGSDVDSPDEAVNDIKVRRVEDTEDDELAVEQELVDDVVEVKHEPVDC